MRELADKDRLRSALGDSIRHHLVADVPVGVFLSWGWIAPTIAALATEAGGQLRTITLGFEEFKGTINDETPLAEQVARHYGARHETVWVRAGPTILKTTSTICSRRWINPPAMVSIPISSAK